MVKGEVDDMLSAGVDGKRGKENNRSSKTKKVLRLSPKSKKKQKPKESHTMREMDGQGACKLNDVLPNGFSDREILELKQAFDLFDKNNDGKISCEELGCVLRSLGHDYTQPEVEEMIKNADKNENGFVEYDEFLILMKRWAANHAARAEAEVTEAEEKTKETFKVFDMDGNGYIDKHELRYVMRRLGENLEEEDVKAMFQLADLNGDGLIDFDEFNKLMGGLSFPLFPKDVGSGEATAHSSSQDSQKKKK
ncbi:calmodulin-like isoform X2 [Haliotis cracherodii]|uniref:calmodulin-like isoform X2 n=1 Tax=Haliotis cracherodii TaxID=6455 RepID=UPI0039E767C3